MTASSEIVIEEVTDAILVPNAALRFSPPQDAAESEGSSNGILGMIMPSRPGPETTTRDRGDGKTVWVLDAGFAREISVETGQSNGKFTEIISGNLTVGDQTGFRRAGFTVFHCLTLAPFGDRLDIDAKVPAQRC
ncbi:MAG: hypothetical protein JKX69_05845, partial [Rhodobacteraceae bacterium]|nr:hypothetical protein [Paracoccaceae bacterium]